MSHSDESDEIYTQGENDEQYYSRDVSSSVSDEEIMEDLVYFSADWPMTSDSYEIISQIGSGMVDSKVYHAKCRTNDYDIAIKEISLKELHPEQISNIINEMAGMNMMSLSESIVSFYCSFIVDNKLWILMELLQASVYDILYFLYPGGMDEIIIASILSQCLTGIRHLHKQGIIHRDIKSANILLKSSGKVQIADLGVSAILSTAEEKRNTVTGTFHWMAPEVLDSKGYTHIADIWSLGITAIEMAWGKPPYFQLSENEVIVKILMEDPPTLSKPNIFGKDPKEMPKKKFSKSFRHFVKSCVIQKSKRKDTKKLKTHKFLVKAKNSAYLKATCLDELPSVAERQKSINKKNQKDANKNLGGINNTKQIEDADSWLSGTSSDEILDLALYED